MKPHIGETLVPFVWSVNPQNQTSSSVSSIGLLLCQEYWYLLFPVWQESDIISRFVSIFVIQVMTRPNST